MTETYPLHHLPFPSNLLPHTPSTGPAELHTSAPSPSEPIISSNQRTSITEIDQAHQHVLPYDLHSRSRRRRSLCGRPIPAAEKAAVVTGLSDRDLKPNGTGRVLAARPSVPVWDPTARRSVGPWRWMRAVWYK